MVNQYFYGLAKVSAAIAELPAEFIYCQWCHETGGFSSALSEDSHNLGGLTQATPNDTPQPDGTCWYMAFPSYEAYAEYFGKYLRLYDENGIYNEITLDNYVTSLYNGGYFGDSLDAYLADCKAIYNENFA